MAYWLSRLCNWSPRFKSFLLFSHQVMYDSLRPHGLQYTAPPCPSLSLGVCSNSCPLSQWCYLNISSSASPLSCCLQSFPASVFSNEWTLYIKWPKYWSFSFSISPSIEYSGLISFRIDWFDLPAVQRTLKSLLQNDSLKELILWCSASFMSNTHIPTYKKNHCFDYTNLCHFLIHYLSLS